VRLSPFRLDGSRVRAPAKWPNPQKEKCPTIVHVGHFRRGGDVVAELYRRLISCDLSRPFNRRRSRTRDPKRILQALRAGVFRRLVDAEHVNELDAEQWIARWSARPRRPVASRGSMRCGMRAGADRRAAFRAKPTVTERLTNADGPQERQRLRERLRTEWIAGAEEEWRRRTGQPTTAEELARLLRR
jgi:hypothetical protein